MGVMVRKADGETGPAQCSSHPVSMWPRASFGMSMSALSAAEMFNSREANSDECNVSPWLIMTIVFT